MLIEDKNNKLLINPKSTYYITVIIYNLVDIFILINTGGMNVTDNLQPSRYLYSYKPVARQYAQLPVTLLKYSGCKLYILNYGIILPSICMITLSI